MAASIAAPSGAQVIEAIGIGKSYEGRPIVSDFSIRIQRGDRIGGIVGPNGSGKTTLIKMLIGALAPDAGSVRLGSTLAAATLDQHRDSLDPDVTATDALTGGGGDTVMVHGSPKHVVTYLKDFCSPANKRARRSASFPAANAADSCWRRFLPSRQTFWSSMSRQTILIWKRWTCSRTCWPNIPERFCSSAMIATFSIVSSTASSRPRETAAGSNMPAAIATCWRSGGADLTRESRKPEPPKAARDPAPRKAEPAPGKRRLAFKDKHALETLPKSIAALQGEMSSLQAKLDDPGFYARDRAGFEDVTATLGELQRKIAAAEEQWLALEILREELAGTGDRA